jgi:hypothetical protein
LRAVPSAGSVSPVRQLVHHVGISIDGVFALADVRTVPGGPAVLTCSRTR